MVMSTESDRVRKFWGMPESTSKRYGRGVHWTESKIVIEYINEQVSGSKEIGWLQYVSNKFLAPLKKELTVLSLGSGTGSLERQLQMLVRVAQVDAFDISEAAVRQAKEAAARDGLGKRINYQVVDLNLIELPKERYDVVFSGSCLHHIRALEHVVSQSAQALKPAGYFIANEYIGPSRFQFPLQQVKVIEDLLVLLPIRYKKRIRLASGYKLHFTPPDPKSMESIDPSEAVRSDEVLPVTKQYLKMVEIRPYGGCILHMLLQDIAGNFDENSEEDSLRLRALVDIEGRLVCSGYLKSDFAVFVMTK